MTRPARAPSPPPRAYLSIGSIVVDNIVLPDARTRMGVLGGGARHAAIGMRVWTERVGLLAAAGRDLPASDRLALERAVDLRRLPRGDALSPRVWQLSEDDGRRTH